jgi:hypothetical protein
MAPLYHAVVAPNDDTLYASVFTEVSQQPLILTIPSENVTFSLLCTDAFGDVFDTGISDAGKYAFEGPNWQGTLPKGVAPIMLPSSWAQVIIRADKYSGTGVDQKKAAEEFRANLYAAPLSEYRKNHNAGKAAILPLVAFSIPWKSIADEESVYNPISFLTTMQAAVASPNTPPLTTREEALSNAFNQLFQSAGTNPKPFETGARDGHTAILNAYLSHTGKTKWITFDSIGTTWTPIVRQSRSSFSTEIATPRRHTIRPGSIGKAKRSTASR